MVLNQWGDMAQEVRAVVWQSEGCRFDPTLGVSKCPWARQVTLIAPDELVGTLHGSQSLLVCECVCEWVNESDKLYRPLDKGAI